MSCRKTSHVGLTVYDLLGREVSVLVNDRREAGVHEVKFDGSGLAAASTSIDCGQEISWQRSGSIC